MIANIEKVLLEFYGFNLLEFAFYVIDGFIVVIAFLAVIYVTFRHSRKSGNPHAKVMFFSFVGLFLSSIVAGFVESSSEGDHYTLLELLVIYLPTVFVVSATVGFMRLCSERQGT